LIKNAAVWQHSDAEMHVIIVTDRCVHGWLGIAHAQYSSCYLLMYGLKWLLDKMDLFAE